MRPWRWVLSCVVCLHLQATNINYHRFMVAIILSEKQCLEQVKENNKTCEGKCGSWQAGGEWGTTTTSKLRGQPGLTSSRPGPAALLFKLGEKAKTLEMEVVKEKAVCAKDKESLLAEKQRAEEQLSACGKARERQQQEQQVTEEELRKVRDLCLPLDHDKLHADALSIWRDSLIPRSLDSLSYHYSSLMPETLRRMCENLPSILSNKVDEKARELRMGIERVTRENSELRRQKLELERGAQSTQEARARGEAEAKARENQLRTECARQTQLALEEKASLRSQKEGLQRELEARKRELEHLRTEVDVRISALDTCVKAKVGLVGWVEMGALGAVGSRKGQPGSGWELRTEDVTEGRKLGQG